ncbi:MAG: tRNA (adenine-N1)-methyltransferase [Anaerolineaceae bacterium]|nr:tRNA (adenine-N1)-methyltransferase [Anaerolineaceae bacterium]
MAWNLHGTHAQDGDLAQLVGLRHKNFIIRLDSGSEFQTHRGVLKHDDLIGKAWGSQVFSHNGSPFFLLQPPLADLLRGIPRNTQIIYPKEIGFILVTMGIGPGQEVVEAGSGSGALTTALAYAVGSQGHVTSYEVHPERVRMVNANLERVGLSDRVTIKARNIADGFDERDVDALFLDLPNPFDYINQSREALKPGGFFGSILPTTNQVVRLLTALRINRFAFIDVCEILLRYYKAESDHFRPTDRMVAHTGFLIFARPIILSDDERGIELLAEANLTDDEKPG